MRVFLILFLSAAFACAEETMSNDGVVKLVKAGMSEELILSIIRNQPGNYALGAAELVTLKDASVSEKLIAAMLEKGKVAAAPAPEPAKQSTAISGKGLFYKKGAEYFELIQEPVEWKTSGAMRNIASAGIVKKDLKGSIAGASSRNFLRHPMEVVIAPPSGMTIDSYILLPLKAEDGEREFNVGPVNKKSGVAKGALPFGVEKVGEGQFRIVLPAPLGPGEYGILAVNPSEAASATGKMYTFRLLL